MSRSSSTADTPLSAIERTLELSVSPARVWRAITDPGELGRWFPDRAEVELRAGGSGSFTWDEYGSFAVQIETVDEPNYLAWRWANDANTPLDAAAEVTLVEWWLKPRQEGGTTLRMRESGFTRAGHRSGNERGWTVEFGELVALIGDVGAAIEPPVDARWEGDHDS